MSENDYDVDDFLRGIHSESNEDKEVEDGNDKQQNRSQTPRKQQILAELPEEVRDKLNDNGNIWTRVSDAPPRFLVARRQRCEIYKARITPHDVTVQGENGGEALKKKIYSFEYGTIVFKIFPIKATLHENPLDFLDSPTTYTITFKNQCDNLFTLTGSTEYIIQRLKEMPGCIVSPHAISETLTAIIGAMEEDGNLIVEKSVPFEGFYFDKKIGDVITSKIDFDKKHPPRTLNEVLDCIKYLEKRAEFQIWDYHGKQIDRKDVLASAIQWTISAPFNFCIKQISGQWQRWFDLGGERDTAKSSLSKEMLRIHGNISEADPIYSMSIGSADTEAKFGKAISKTTYPIEISEIKTIEDYGRNENLVSMFLTSPENLISRKGREGNRYDAPFPACSSVILNGNWLITRKGEVAKRMHIIRSSEEDMHSRDPNTPFNRFHTENGWKIKILGDWTIRYIYEHRKELLIDGKYNTYEIARVAIEEFYRSMGKTVPDWLTHFIPDTVQEELDIDDEAIIRGILFDTVNRTLERSAKLVNIGALESDSDGYNNKIYRVKNTTLAERIEICLNNDLWSWIRKIQRPSNGLSTESESEYYIDTGILELFSKRLPNLDLRKLGQKMGLGFEYQQKKGGRRTLKCTKSKLIEFIQDKELEGLEVEIIS